MLVGKFNPPLCCAKILKHKTLRDSRPDLTFSRQAIVVKNEKTLIEVPLPV